MLGRFIIASIAILGAIAVAEASPTTAQAKPAATQPNPAATKPKPAATSPPAAQAVNTTQVSVLSASEVVQILDQTSEWYRTLGLQQQNASQPGEVLILYGNRQIADKVIDLVIELARADAELLSSEANAAQASADKSAVAAFNQQREQLAAQHRSIQQEIAADQQKLKTAGRGSKELESKLAELQGELAMNAARANLLDTMGEFVTQRDPKSADAEALKAHIDAIAASIPAGESSPAPAPAATAASSTAARSGAVPAASNAGVEKANVRDGIWDLAKNVFDLRAKIKSIEVIDARSKDLANLFHKYSEAPRTRLQSYAAASDALAAAAVVPTVRRCRSCVGNSIPWRGFSSRLLRFCCP